jgi:negative regulator of flagellin synthesis FlgM
MTIGRIDSPEPVQPGRKPGQANRAVPAERSDTIDVSSEAVERSELYRMAELAASAPDVREDRIAELRQKINDPSYIDNRVLDATADAIMGLFGI